MANKTRLLDKSNRTAPWLEIVLIIGGAIWLARFGIALLKPTYWNPRTFLDYLAVYGTTLKQWFLAAGLIGISQRYPTDTRKAPNLWSMGVKLAILMVILMGLFNLLEDAAGLKFFGNFWIMGFMGSFIGLLLAAVGAFRHPEIPSRLGWFILAAIAGFQDYGDVVTGTASLILALAEKRQNSNKT